MLETALAALKSGKFASPGEIFTWGKFSLTRETESSEDPLSTNRQIKNLQIELGGAEQNIKIAKRIEIAEIGSIGCD